MSPPDRALRRMAVDLAALHADDIAAVLDHLDSAQRQQVEELLRDLSDFGFGHRVARPVEGTAGIDTSNISPWLEERLRAGSSDSRMTPSAASALRDCALHLYPLSAASKKSSGSRNGLDPFGRMRSVFATGETS